jgi:hypothetical protein
LARAAVFGAAARLETRAPLAVLAAVFLAGLGALATLLLAEGLDFDGRLAAFVGRLNGFFVAFFRVVMTRFLLKLSAPGVL